MTKKITLNKKTLHVLTAAETKAIAGGNSSNPWYSNDCPWLEPAPVDTDPNFGNTCSGTVWTDECDMSK